MCTSLINALNTVSSYVSPSNLIVDYSSQVATTYNNTSGSPIYLQNVSGSTLDISIPSNIDIENKQVNLVISGYFSGGHTPVLNLWTASGSAIFLENNGIGTSTYKPFSGFISFIWNSESGLVVPFFDAPNTGYSNLTGITSQSQISFNGIINFGESNTTDFVTVTQLKLQFT